MCVYVYHFRHKLRKRKVQRKNEMHITYECCSYVDTKQSKLDRSKKNVLATFFTLNHSLFAFFLNNFDLVLYFGSIIHLIYISSFFLHYDPKDLSE